MSNFVMNQTMSQDASCSVYGTPETVQENYSSENHDNYREQKAYLQFI